MRSSVEPTTDDPADLYDAFALVKREEEQVTLGTLSGDRKLNHYPDSEASPPFSQALP